MSEWRKDRHLDIHTEKLGLCGHHSIVDQQCRGNSECLFYISELRRQTCFLHIIHIPCFYLPFHSFTYCKALSTVRYWLVPDTNQASLCSNHLLFLPSCFFSTSFPFFLSFPFSFIHSSLPPFIFFIVWEHIINWLLKMHWYIWWNARVCWKASALFSVYGICSYQSIKQIKSHIHWDVPQHVDQNNLLDSSRK